MAKYDVEITLRYSDEVEADTYKEAMEKAVEIADYDAAHLGDWEIDVDRVTP